MRKTTVSTLIFMSLLASTAFYQQTVNAQYQRYITINADGSISPSSVPIVQNGNTYTLTSDVKGGILIRKSNITFNGNGHMLDQYATSQDQGNAYGIYLGHVYNVTVVNTTIKNTGNGVYAIEQPTAGIYVDYGGSNIIIGNNVLNNYHALAFLESNNNIVTQNNFTNNNNPVGIVGSVGAVMFWGSSNNLVYHNNFIGNISPAGIASFDSPSSGNAWDNGKEGNYWDDYNGTDADGDGIGDASYEIYTKNTGGALYPRNTDRYPLINPFNHTFYLQKTIPPQITLLSPLHQVYNGSSVDLVFTTDGVVNWTAYSLDGKQNVTVTGNSTITGIPSGSHKLVVYANDTFGRMGVSEELTFAVAVPEPSPLIFLGAGLGIAVLIVGLSLFVYVKKRLTASRSIVRGKQT
jgi:parallel beta-helix repeat protein